MFIYIHVFAPVVTLVLKGVKGALKGKLMGTLSVRFIDIEAIASNGTLTRTLGATDSAMDAATQGKPNANDIESALSTKYVHEVEHSGVSILLLPFKSELTRPIRSIRCPQELTQPCGHECGFSPLESVGNTPRNLRRYS